MKAVLDHVGIAVRDLQAALAFYRDALGLEVEAPRTWPRRRCVRIFSRWAIEPGASGGDLARLGDREVRGKARPGLHHITLRVDDISAALAQLKARAPGSSTNSRAPAPREHSLLSFIHRVPTECW